MLKLKENGYELKRLNELRSYDILDSITEEEYENITYLASMICDVPIAVISLVDENRQWFKSHKGLPISETLREYSFCAHAINSTQEFLIIPDSRTDHRFRDNPLVTGDPNIVFYAGVPLINENGYGLGTVCVIDKKPRELTKEQLKGLKILSSQVMSLLETRKANAELEKVKQQLERKNKELEESKKKLEKSERRLRTMSQGTDVMISMVDDENEPIFFTKAWSVFIGKSIDEMLLFGWTDNLHPEDKEAFLETYFEAFENRTPYSAEFRLADKTGHYTWFLSHGSPQILDDGSFGGFISSTVDISNLKSIQNDLTITSKRLELALEAGRLGTYELNVKSGTMKTSSVYKSNFGLDDNSKTTFSSLLSMVESDDRPLIHHALSKAIKENATYDVEYRVKHSGGEIKWMHSLGIPVYDDAGEAIFVSGVSIDITAQKT